MKHLLYSFVMGSFALTYAADKVTFKPPRQHLSIYDKDFATMTVRQRSERRAHIERSCETRDARWLEEKPHRKLVRDTGINCCLIGVPIVVTIGEACMLLKSTAGTPSPIIGINGPIAGVCGAKLFDRWYRPSQPHREQDIREIDRLSKQDKLKQD
jgi:hypothetical protein